MELQMEGLSPSQKLLRVDEGLERVHPDRGRCRALDELKIRPGEDQELCLEDYIAQNPFD